MNMAHPFLGQKSINIQAMWPTERTQMSCTIGKARARSLFPVWTRGPNIKVDNSTKPIAQTTERAGGDMAGVYTMSGPAELMVSVATKRAIPLLAAQLQA